MSPPGPLARAFGSVTIEGVEVAGEGFRDWLDAKRLDEAELRTIMAQVGSAAVRWIAAGMDPADACSTAVAYALLIGFTACEIAQEPAVLGGEG